MRLTTKGRYAVTAMMDLAYHSKENPITLTDIATRQTISLSYLEQLFSRLRRAGMVQGVRGRLPAFPVLRRFMAGCLDKTSVLGISHRLNGHFKTLQFDL